MKGVIKAALAEELKNSLRMKKEYESALRKLPKGSLALRTIRGHEYAYVVVRDGAKVKFTYKGKVSKPEREKYRRTKELRAKYRRLLSELKKQIRFLRSTQRGKEPI